LQLITGSSAAFYLLLSAVSESFFQILLRLSQVRGRNMMATISVNYLTASFICYAALKFFGGNSPSRFTLSFAVIMGIVFLAAMFLTIASLNQRGVALTGSIAQLAVLLPTVMSILIWLERLTVLQSCGVVITAVSLPLLTLKKSESNTLGQRSVLTAAGLFVVNGFTLAAGKVLLEAGYIDQQAIFYCVLFATSFVASTPMLLRSRKNKPVAMDVGYGLAIGVLNAITCLALMTALIAIPGSISFPVFSVISSLVIIFVSFVILHERINRLNGVGIILSIIAAVLLRP